MDLKKCILFVFMIFSSVFCQHSKNKVQSRDLVEELENREDMSLQSMIEKVPQVEIEKFQQNTTEESFVFRNINPFDNFKNYTWEEATVGLKGKNFLVLLFEPKTEGIEKFFISYAKRGVDFKKPKRKTQLGSEFELKEDSTHIKILVLKFSEAGGYLDRSKFLSKNLEEIYA